MKWYLSSFINTLWNCLVAKIYRKVNTKLNALFFLVLVTIFKRGFRINGNEFLKTKRGFLWEQAK